MSSSRVGALFCLIGLVLATTPAWAQEAGGQEAPPCSETARVADSVEAMAAVLQAGQEQQGEDMEMRRLQIAVSYLEFRSRALEKKEDELRGYRAWWRNLADNDVRSEQVLATFREQARDAPPDQKASYEESIERYQKAIADLDSRRAKIESQMLDLENEIAQMRRELAPLEEYVQAHLELDE